jgi:HlyD family secretion protein
MMSSKWLLAGASVLVLAILSGSLIYRRALRKESQATRVETPASSASEIILPGQVEPVTVVRVPAAVDGSIEHLTVKVGATVFEGELLAHIRNPGLESARQKAAMELEQARNNANDIESNLVSAKLEASRSHAAEVRAKGDLERVEKEYVRQEMLNREGATPRLVFEKAQQEYAALKAEASSLADRAGKDDERVALLSNELPATQAAVEQKSNDLEEAMAELAAGDIRSPVDGVVLAIHGQAGEPVGRETPELFELGSDLTQLQVPVIPDAKTLPRIHPGQEAVIEIAAATVKIPGIVREVRQGVVLVGFSSPSSLVRPGQQAQVKIRLGGSGSA